MSCNALNLSVTCRFPAVLATLLLTLSCSSMAEDSLPSGADSSETGVNIGLITFIGTDIRIYHRAANSRFIFGIRYIDYEEDFINETIVGLPNEPSDKLHTSRTGLYADYLFDKHDYYNSFFASASLLQTTKELKCNPETDSNSATGLYLGGGYRGSFSYHFGYTVGMLISPFVNFDEKTTTCESNEDGDFDLHLGITYRF